MTNEINLSCQLFSLYSSLKQTLLKRRHSLDIQYLPQHCTHHCCVCSCLLQHLCSRSGEELPSQFGCGSQVHLTSFSQLHCDAPMTLLSRSLFSRVSVHACAFTVHCCLWVGGAHNFVLCFRFEKTPLPPPAVH